ncbi:MAG: beta-ketoacyl synthase N-terminal-like domain-containing protein [Pseudomonadota bacterium]
MNNPNIIDGMKVSRHGVERLDGTAMTWNELKADTGMEDGLPPRRIRSGFRKAQKMADPVARLAMMCAEPLLQNAAGKAGMKTMEGIALGSMMGCLLADVNFMKTAIPDHGEKASPIVFKNTLPSIPVGEICIAFNIKGPNVLVNAGEVSGITAIIQAVEWIRQLHVSTCLAGGFDIDCPDLRRLFPQALRGEGYVSSGYFFVLSARKEVEGTRPFGCITNHRSFFEPDMRKPLEYTTLGNKGMEELWQALKNGKPGEQTFSQVSFDGHGAMLEIEIEPERKGEKRP